MMKPQAAFVLTESQRSSAHSLRGVFFGWVVDHAAEQLWIFCTVDGKLLVTPPLQYVDCAPKDCDANIAADGPWCLHRPMKLLLPDLLRLVLLAEDVTQVGVDVEALVVAWHAWNN